MGGRGRQPAFRMMICDRRQAQADAAPPERRRQVLDVGRDPVRRHRQGRRPISVRAPRHKGRPGSGIDPPRPGPKPDRQARLEITIRIIAWEGCRQRGQFSLQPRVTCAGSAALIIIASCPAVKITAIGARLIVLCYFSLQNGGSRSNAT